MQLLIFTKCITYFRIHRASSRPIPSPFQAALQVDVQVDGPDPAQPKAAKGKQEVEEQEVEEQEVSTIKT
jgi:hypothetical protein